jgi:hypothetical protein
MSKPEDGGKKEEKYAFPNVQDGDRWDGMTLRQYAAIKAMQGILASSQVWVSPHDFDEIAKRSWGMADSLLKAGGE